jgi:ABC-type lipoprotein export system ATPase subunit
VHYPDGARWTKWDLHVHTPASLVNGYGDECEDVWERFLTELEALPPDTKVLGINDYLFLDGYRRVREERSRGRLPNIELVLPVIELRLDRFGGSKNKLSRVNFHVIFSDKVDPDVIQEQFLSALSAKYQLNPLYSSPSISWSGVPTRAALEDLGRKIIATVPESELAHFKSPLMEGFNNLNLSQDSIIEALNKEYFKDLHHTAVGKTEWADLKWTDQSIAEKKNVINSVDWVFTAAASPTDGLRAKESLLHAGVNSRLLDCSDAHTWTGSMDKDRLGNCFTWIHADTEFEGLRQALREPEARVYLGDMPDPLVRVSRNGTKYIKEVVIRRKPEAEIEDLWFTGEPTTLNPGLVAIIGNKGSGKSALLDVLGLMGNSRRQDSASFLSKDRFKKPSDNKASAFEAVLRWCNGESSTPRSLDSTVDQTDVERVTYIPQKLFDSICNELASHEKGPFDLELKRVIFSHVDAADRLGHKDLDSWIDARSSELIRVAELRRIEVSHVNRQILLFEARLKPEYRDSLVNRLTQRRAELSAHEEGKPIEVDPPLTEPDENETSIRSLLEVAKNSLVELDGQILRANLRLEELARELVEVSLLRQRVEELRREVTRFVNEWDVQFAYLGFEAERVISFDFDLGPLEEADMVRLVEQTRLRELLGDDSLTQVLDDDTKRRPTGLGSTIDSVNTTYSEQRSTLTIEINNLRQQLSAVEERYQLYLVSLHEWEKARAIIVGSSEIAESELGLQHEIQQLATLPSMHAEACSKRTTLVYEIHGLLMQRKALYQELYKPVQQFIDQHGAIASEVLDLRVDATIINSSLERGFIEFINRGRAGSFAGKEESSDRLRSMLSEVDFNHAEQCVRLADDLLTALTTDLRDSAPKQVHLSTQLRQDKSEQDLYDYLFGLTYLEIRFSLKLGNRELRQLSPGQKGALLLVFYLLVDRSDTPLLIDQPEENLDNQTVVGLLVPAIMEAKKRRQIIMVTHNPNLAVVCDAAQIICAERGIGPGTQLAYISGSIEDPVINRKIQDILEGTRLAFNNRGGKYQELTVPASNTAT